MFREQQQCTSKTNKRERGQTDKRQRGRKEEREREKKAEKKEQWIQGKGLKIEP